MNMYFVYDDGHIVTPETGTILEGITRASIIELAGKLGHQVEERKFSIDEWRDGVDQRPDHRDLRLRHRRGRHPGRRAEVGRRRGAVRAEAGDRSPRRSGRRWSTSSTAAPRTPSAGCTGSSDPVCGSLGQGLAALAARLRRCGRSAAARRATSGSAASSADAKITLYWCGRWASRAIGTKPSSAR